MAEVDYKKFSPSGKSSAIIDIAPDTIIRKAVFLPMGGWERLSPLTKRFPPNIFPLFNEPFIEHNIEYLLRKKLTDIVVVLLEEQGLSQLEEIKENCDEECEELMDEQIQNLKQERDRVRKLAKEEKAKNGLFGWLV